MDNDDKYTRTVEIESVEVAPEPHREPFIRETVGGNRKREALGFGRLAVLVILAALFFGAGVGLAAPLSEKLFSGITQAAPEDKTSGTELTKGFVLGQAENMSQTAAPQSSGYAGLIEQVEPSVVSIITNTQYISQSSGIFGDGGSGIFGGGGGGIIDVPAAGSGILFHETDTHYYIATNYHVIESASEITVSICGSEPIIAAYIDGNPGSDLAVISVQKSLVEAAGVKSVKLAVFGSSGSMRVGDEVLAIGNALGEGNTATNGIISAKDKSITIDGVTLEVLQTNAAINPGNSGGPLINMNGEIIGINTAKISQSSAEGMGYSIPSDIAKPIIEEIMNIVNKPFIGIQLATISDELAQQYSLPSAGAIIKGIVPGSPAENSDLQVDDIITSFNGQPVLSSEQLIEYVGECKIGDVCELKLIRNGKDFVTVEITLGHR